MLKREMESKCLELASRYPVVTLTGPRQSGKTTLVRQVFKKKAYVNLEDPSTRDFAITDPRGFLGQYPEGAIFDEIQRAPELTSYIQPIVDKKNSKGMYILTGSQQFELTHSVNQSLAGRTGLLKLLPLSLAERYKNQEIPDINTVISTGFYPRIYNDQLPAKEFYSNYFETYVERDLRQLSQITQLRDFERFVKLLSGRIGQLLNLSSLANDCGISHTTASHWLSILEASYIVFLLQPWHVNLGKRLIKSPKVYFVDVGLAAFLLGLSSQSVVNHPLKGHLFENMVVTEFLKHRFNQGLRSNLYFFRDSTGNEVDLILENVPNSTAIEIKMGQTPLAEFQQGILKLDGFLGKEKIKGFVVYGGDEVQKRTNAEYVPWKTLPQKLKKVSELA